MATWEWMILWSMMTRALARLSWSVSHPRDLRIAVTLEKRDQSEHENLAALFCTDSNFLVRDLLPE